MSKFSDKCRKLLIENGSNVYQLSTRFSLEHTTLQRMVTGKRLPKVEFVKSFCRSLRLSKSEEEELLELYRRESMGEDAYNSEQSILRLMRHLKELEELDETESIVSVDFNYIKFHSNISTETHDTELLIHLILAEEFADKNTGAIYTNLPRQGECYFPFIHSLELLYRQYKKRLLVQHIIHFHINASLNNENLDILNQILPLFLSDTLDYQVFYYYSRLTQNDCKHMLFPYYIITSKHLLLISFDFRKALKLSDSKFIEQYLQEFKKVKTLSKPLFQRVSILDKAQSLYSVNSLSTNANITVFHYQPCYVDLIGNDGLIQKVNTHLPQFRTASEQFFSSLTEKTSNLNFICFSDFGIEEFCRTGKYYGQVGAFFPPFDLKERIKGLTYFQKNTFSSNNVMVKGSLLSFPKHLYFELQGIQVLQIINIESFEKMDFIIIEESSICEAFQQFFYSLPSSKYAYTKEETDVFITEKITEMSRKLQSF